MKFEKGAPVIGLVLQRSHLVTGDEGHYSGVVANLEARGAKVPADPSKLIPVHGKRCVWLTLAFCGVGGGGGAAAELLLAARTPCSVTQACR